MQTALVVTVGQKSISFFSDILKEASFYQITNVNTCSEARRIIMQYDYDLVIINAPLKDETGERLSKDISALGKSQVILVVSSTHFEQVSSVVEDYGVFTVSKPINRVTLWAILKLVKATQSRVRIIAKENKKLKNKIEDIKLIDRAKCTLISCMGIDEERAHRYIEKEAMDSRKSRQEIAKEIIKKYS